MSPSGVHTADLQLSPPPTSPNSSFSSLVRGRREGIRGLQGIHMRVEQDGSSCAMIGLDKHLVRETQTFP